MRRAAVALAIVAVGLAATACTSGHGTNSNLGHRNEIAASAVAPACVYMDSQAHRPPLTLDSPLPCAYGNVAGIFYFEQDPTYQGCLDVVSTTNDGTILPTYHVQRHNLEYCPLIDTHPTVSNDR
jgi:hypothetical protein